MSGQAKWTFAELQQLDPSEFETLIDEIPSDCESEESSDLIDNPEESLIMEGLVDDVRSLFDIESMNIDILDDEQYEQVCRRDIDPSPTIARETDGWNTEDEMPLSQLQLQLWRLTTVWTSDATFCTKPSPFIQETGPIIPEDVESPTDIFIHLFTNCLIEKIVFQTNLYALQKSGGNSRAFLATTASEIKTFLGLNILMGLKSMPSYRDHWSSRIELRDPYITNAMGRDRFGWLLSNLHMNDNATQPTKQDPKFDKLYKVWPLIDTLSESYLKSFAPNEHQAIDESMIRYKGRSSLRQYMPNKPIKRGYKVWVRGDETGYVSQFQIYTGKVGDLTEKALGERVIKDLSRELVGKNHKVYFDNFFNSVHLQKHLLSDQIYACGTARKNRKQMPTDLRDDKLLRRGDSDYRVSKDGVVALKWMDKKAVLFISNFHDPTELKSVSRRRKDGSREEVTCPVLVNDYNRHMGYVDKFDMLKSLYEIDRKSRKWWHRIFWYFVDATVVNSYTIFNTRLPSKMTLKEFRLSVVSGLIGAISEESKRGRKRNENIPNKFKTIVPLELKYARSY